MLWEQREGAAMNVKTILLVSCGAGALAVGTPAWAVP